jgi:hypothetical protein
LQQSITQVNIIFNVRALRHCYASDAHQLFCFLWYLSIFKVQAFVVWKKKRKSENQWYKKLYNHIVYSHLDSTCIPASDCILLLLKMLLFQYHSSCQIIALIILTIILIDGFKILLLGSEM